MVKWAYPVSNPLYFSLIARYGQRLPSNLRHEWSEEWPGKVITHEKVYSGSDKANSDKCKEMRKHWGMTKGFSHVDGDQKNVKHTHTKKPGPRCAENTLKSNGYKILKTGTVLTFCKGIPGKRRAFTAVSLFSFLFFFCVKLNSSSQTQPVSPMQQEPPWSYDCRMLGIMEIKWLHADSKQQSKSVHLYLNSRH